MKLLFLPLLIFLLLGCVQDKKSKLRNDDKLLIYTTFENEQVSQYIQAFNAAYPNI